MPRASDPHANKMKVWQVTPEVETEHKPVRSTWLTNLVKIPIDFSYYLFCCPFRLTLTKDEEADKQTCAIKRWLPQAVLCVIFTISDFFYMIYLVRRSSFKINKASNPADFIDLFGVITSHIMKVVAIKSFWFNHRNYMKIINNIIPEIKSSHSNGKKEKRAIMVVAVLYVAFGILNWTGLSGIGTGYQVPHYTLTFSTWWAEMVQQGHKAFFLIALNATNTSEIIDPTFYLSTSALDIFLGLLTAAGIFQRQLEIQDNKI